MQTAVDRPIRTLLFSTLYPSSVRPVHGIFVETRLRELLRTGSVQTKVMAPVPWFPSRHPRFGEYAQMAATPQREIRNGIDVLHPRYPLIPKLGMTLAPALLAAASVRPIQQLLDEGFDFDVIDAHYFYPDGVAAAWLARWFGKALVITARGSDVNLIADHALPRRMIRWAACQAAASVGVSQALSNRLLALGAPIDRVLTLRNGVDTQFFKPLAQADARQLLGVKAGPVLLAVGNLLPVKRVGLVIEALACVRQQHPAAMLCIVGDGPLRSDLQAMARSLGLSDAVHFAGAVPQQQLACWYSAADVLVLASSREGWPNVLLEAMACGTPVVASRVGGVAEIVSSPVLGAALTFDHAGPLAQALLQTLAAPPARQAIRRHAQGMGWASVSAAQREMLARVVAGRATPAALQEPDHA